MESFEVENFRSLKHLKLEKLARVNLLVGKNNSGKTSVLEGLYVVNNIEDGDWILSIDREGKAAISEAHFRYLFYKFNGEIPFSLSVKYSNSNLPSAIDGSIVLQAFLSENYSNAYSKQSDTAPIRPRPQSKRREAAEAELYVSLHINSEVNSLDFKIIYDSVGQEFSQVPYSQDAREFLINSQRRVQFGTRRNTMLVATKYSPTLLSIELEALTINKRLDQVVALLGQVESKINSISLGATGQIYLDLGDSFPTLVPLTLSGDGIQRLLVIVTAIANTVGGIVLIDEIDNGLHYSALRILWKGILQAAREYDVQVFATTHSAEALRHLTAVLEDEEYASYRNDIAAYTLIRANDDTVRSYRYDYEQLDFAMEHDMEVRN